MHNWDTVLSRVKKFLSYSKLHILMKLYWSTLHPYIVCRPSNKISFPHLSVHWTTCTLYFDGVENNFHYFTYHVTSFDVIKNNEVTEAFWEINGKKLLWLCPSPWRSGLLGRYLLTIILMLGSKSRLQSIIQVDLQLTALDFTFP